MWGFTRSLKLLWLDCKLVVLANRYHNNSQQVFKSAKFKFVYSLFQDGPIKVAIRGGTDTPLGGAIIISRILEGGAAARYGKLNVGDQILVCDGVSLIDVTHDEAAQALKNAMDMESVRG